MKLKKLTALVGLVALLTGCNKEEGSALPTSDETTTTFTVTVNDASSRTNVPASRAAAETPIRYILEFYEGKAPLAANATPVQHIEQANGSFSVFLKDNTDYIVLFWADYDKLNDNTNNVFNAADLKKVSINPTKKAVKPAWSGVEVFTTGGPDDADKNKSITLTHAVAQVCFKQTDELDFAQATGNLLKMKFPQTYSLNVSDRTATEIKDGSGNSVPREFEFAVEGTAKSLGTLLVIARGDGTEIKTMMDITTEFKASATATPEAVKTITNIPLRANFKTNIIGAYSDIYTSAVKVTCDESWEATGYEEVFPRPANVADFYYKDGSYGSIYKPNASNPCIGIVFWVDPTDATHGKIMSLSEPEDLLWGEPTTVERENVNGISSLTDGETGTHNMIMAHKGNDNFSTVYSAFHYVFHTMNNGDVNGRWYIPALNELQYLLCARKGAAPKTWEYNDGNVPSFTTNSVAATKLKVAIEVASGTPFNNDRGHWVSTENPGEWEGTNVYVLYGDGSFEPWGYKADDNRRLRCISKF